MYKDQVLSNTWRSFRSDYSYRVYINPKLRAALTPFLDINTASGKVTRLSSLAPRSILCSRMSIPRDFSYRELLARVGFVF